MHMKFTVWALSSCMINNFFFFLFKVINKRSVKIKKVGVSFNQINGTLMKQIGNGGYNQLVLYTPEDGDQIICYY